MPTYFARVKCKVRPIIPETIRDIVVVKEMERFVLAKPKAGIPESRRHDIFDFGRRVAAKEREGSLHIPYRGHHIFSVGPVRAEDKSAAITRVRMSYSKPRCQVVEVTKA